MTRNRTGHHIDLQPLRERSTAVILGGLHLYQDTPLTSYFARPGFATLIPQNDPPFRFVFLPEFTGCRLLVKHEGDAWLQLQVEEGLTGASPMPQGRPDSPYLDSFAYWDQISGDLVGNIRATAILVKESTAPWTIFMQQIVGSAGHEVVRAVFSRKLTY